MTTTLLPAGMTVGVVGAGAMGAGIAQVAAMHGHPVVLADAHPAALERAKAGHAKALAREVEKGRLERAAADAVLGRLTYHALPAAQSGSTGSASAGTAANASGAPSGFAPFAPCGLVVEAIIEALEPKRALVRALDAVLDPSAVIATNTSSLSVAAIAGASTHPARVIGLHFFNPAPVMPLVEVIPAIVTDAAVTEAAHARIAAWGKVVVRAKDTPGFIVNRVARPFYGEALRILEEGIADAATIDWAMRERGGFKMGPFELMDFIGNDVNFAVTRSVFDATFQDPRYRPAVTQQRLVEAGLLGRKSGRGYHDYRDGAAAASPTTDLALAERILHRILAMLVNEAVEAVHWGIAAAADVELAMTKGVNYPRGLLAWGDAIGPATILATLELLQAEYGEDRYRPSVRLRRLVREGGSLLA